MGVTRRNEERVFRIPDHVRYAAGRRRHDRSGSCERFEHGVRHAFPMRGERDGVGAPKIRSDVVNAAEKKQIDSELTGACAEVTSKRPFAQERDPRFRIHRRRGSDEVFESLLPHEPADPEYHNSLAKIRDLTVRGKAVDVDAVRKAPDLVGLGTSACHDRRPDRRGVYEDDLGAAREHAVDRWLPGRCPGLDAHQGCRHRRLARSNRKRRDVGVNERRVDEIRLKLVDESGETRGSSDDRPGTPTAGAQIDDSNANGVEVSRDIPRSFGRIEVHRQARDRMLELGQRGDRGYELATLSTDLEIGDDVEDAQAAQLQRPLEAPATAAC
jgi:hypothetical protein